MQLWATADALREVAGNRRGPRARRYEAQVEVMRARLDEEAPAEAEGRAMTLGGAVAYALADQEESN